MLYTCATATSTSEHKCSDEDTAATQAHSLADTPKVTMNVTIPTEGIADNTWAPSDVHCGRPHRAVRPNTT